MFTKEVVILILVAAPLGFNEGSSFVASAIQDKKPKYYWASFENINYIITVGKWASLQYFDLT